MRHVVARRIHRHIVDAVEQHLAYRAKTSSEMLEGSRLCRPAGKNDGATREEFADYELELEYQLPSDGNSGVYLRGVTEIQVETNR